MAGDEGPSNKTGSNTSDHESPYYLHPSDYPRQMQVNDALSDKNYADWVQEMENFLFAKNKIGFIDGTIVKPEKTSKEYMAWMRCDAMIKGWLTTAMEKEIRGSVKYASTASEIWSDLRERFGKESAPRAYELKNQLSTTRQDGTSVSAYYTKLRSLWDEIQSTFPTPKCTCNGCTCGIGKRLVEHQEKEKLYEFLMGLDGDFAVIKTQILATSPTPALGSAYHLVAEDERQRAITGDKKPSIETAAFKASMSTKRDGNSGQQRNKPNQNPVKQEAEKQHCTFCDKSGHNRDGCFKRIGYPEWWPGKGKTDKDKPRAACIDASPIPGLTENQYKAFLKHFGEENKHENEETIPVANMTGRSSDDDDWVVDSGATEHTTYRADILTNKTKRNFERPVVIPNGDAIPVEGRGRVVPKLKEFCMSLILIAISCL
ncbi:hypothetical protein L2E82_33550 [Cichorium intybus]|uniref:Uncharacterized protein n=1 Tax=Cichorium intybus TaxID=13427 RepID=A0ACB9BKG3_CICIN|nr:hypothetical protein L2E82_33550 [Cichorium intybus]